MAILPTGFALPPLPYLLGLLAATGFVAWGFRERSPRLTEQVALSTVPWMLAGAWLHVLSVLDAAPAALAPLLGTPSVYVTVAVLAGAVWLLSDAGHLPRGGGEPRPAATLAVSGSLLALFPLAATLEMGLARGALTPVWPGIALVTGLAIGWVWWRTLGEVDPGIEVTGWVGAMAVIGHAVDAVSTAVGVDVLGFGERTPLSRLLIDLGHALPTADLLGGAWLFVLVKLAVVGGVVWLLADLVREDPGEGRALLLVVTAVGLGPGAHNLLLFTVS